MLVRLARLLSWEALVRLLPSLLPLLLLAAGFQTMRDRQLLDLANRKGKAPGGYQSTLAEARLPFIFMNAVGVQRDVETMLHEAGHAVAGYLLRRRLVIDIATIERDRSGR